jgi:HNH endonuclease/NUMOD1 domain
MEAQIRFAEMEVDGEIGRCIPEFEDYVVFRDSKVYSLISVRKSKWVCPTKVGGYMNIGLVRTTVQDDGSKVRKRTTFRLNQVVAKAYIPNSLNRPQVNHLDGNKLNNHVDNLEWATGPENMDHAVKNGLTHPGKSARPVLQYSLDGEFIQRFNTRKDAAKSSCISVYRIGAACESDKNKHIAGDFIWRNETEKEDWIEIPGEEWRSLEQYPDHTFSSEGRVYSQMYERCLTNLPCEDGYVRVNLRDRANHKKQKRVHVLIVQAFLGDAPEGMERPVVNHKDGNKANNRISNLEWISFSGNIQAAYDTGQNPNQRPCIQYSLEGEEIARFKSPAEAMRQTHIEQNHINNVCKKKPNYNTAGGYLWRYVTDPLTPEDLVRVTQLIKKSRPSVQQFTIKGEYIKTFRSMAKAARKCKIDSSAIIQSCKRKSLTGAGFIWRYEGDTVTAEDLKRKPNLRRKVKQYTFEGKFVAEYETSNAAAKAVGASNGSVILKACDTTKGTHICKGFLWFNSSAEQPTKEQCIKLSSRGRTISRSTTE